jgi:hypothetical protein
MILRKRGVVGEFFRLIGAKDSEYILIARTGPKSLDIQKAW